MLVDDFGKCRLGENQCLDRIDCLNRCRSLSAIKKRDFAQHVARFCIIQNDFASVGGYHTYSGKASDHDEQRPAFFALHHQILAGLVGSYIAARDNIGKFGLFAIRKQTLRR